MSVEELLLEGWIANPEECHVRVVGDPAAEAAGVVEGVAVWMSGGSGEDPVGMPYGVYRLPDGAALIFEPDPRDFEQSLRTIATRLSAELDGVGLEGLEVRTDRSFVPPPCLAPETPCVEAVAQIQGAATMGHWLWVPSRSGPHVDLPTWCEGVLIDALWADATWRTEWWVRGMSGDLPASFVGEWLSNDPAERPRIAARSADGGVAAVGCWLSRTELCLGIDARLSVAEFLGDRARRGGGSVTSEARPVRTVPGYRAAASGR